jgi:hypothetical protein
MDLAALHRLVRSAIRDGRTSTCEVDTLTGSEVAAMRLWQRRLSQAGHAARLEPPIGAIEWMKQLRGTGAT